MNSSLVACALAGILLAAGCGGADLAPGSEARALTSTGQLRFAVWGDSRPPLPDDVWGYPTSVVASVFSQMHANGVQFAIGTGDYVFGGGVSLIGQQVDKLLGAEANLGGPVYHALGNHDCSPLGITASNCPNANESSAIKAFMSRLTPAGTAHPYYRVDVDTALGTAKFLMLAANAWTDAQAAWLTEQLRDQTAYTFIVRHEPPADASAPGVTPSEDILASAHYTLGLFGHEHTYQHLDARRVVSGNGGAPLAQGADGYGFVMVDQMSDGSLSVTEVDAVSGNPRDTWSVAP